MFYAGNSGGLLEAKSFHHTDLHTYMQDEIFGVLPERRILDRDTGYQRLLVSG